MRQRRQLSESCRNRGDQKKVAAQRRPTPHCDKPFCEKFGKSEACTNRGLADSTGYCVAHIPRGSAVVCFSVSVRQARVMSNGCCGVYRVVPSTREDKVGHAGISEDDFNRPIRSAPIIPLQRGHAGRIAWDLLIVRRGALLRPAVPVVRIAVPRSRDLFFACPR